MGRMVPSASIAIFPLGGPFHTRWPRYTVVHVRESVKAFRPHAIALAPLAPRSLADPAWQDTDELALPHTVVPWALSSGVALAEVGLAPDDPDDPGHEGAVRELRGYLELYEDGLARLRRVEAAWGPVRELLAQPLDLRRVITELLPAVEEQQAVQTEALGEGPGDAWREPRAAVVASRVLAAARAAAPRPAEGGTVRLAVMAGVESVPALRRALTGPAAAASGVRVQMVEPPEVEAGQEGRARALLDAAHAGVGDPDSTLRNLAAIPAAEARYVEASLLLELGRLDEALAKLEALVAGDFSRPYYLPGFVLARLGQVLDLAARRDDAVRSYRGVMALSYAPPAARDAAESGLAAPFTLPEARNAHDA